MPLRTSSITPLMISLGLASTMPAGFTLGQTSTHLPHRVQASSMSSTRSPKTVSKELSFSGCMSNPRLRTDESSMVLSGSR
jgi:hypothetical protein